MNYDSGSYNQAGISFNDAKFRALAEQQFGEEIIDRIFRECDATGTKIANRQCKETPTDNRSSTRSGHKQIEVHSVTVGAKAPPPDKIATFDSSLSLPECSWLHSSSQDL